MSTDRKGLEMLSDNLSKMLNDQINAELYSAYLYWDFAKYFDCNNLPGIASWYKAQAAEEIDHAKRIYAYMQKQGGAIHFKKIEKSKDTPKGCVEIARAALNHEKSITQMIHNIYEEATKEKDYRTMNFLLWFIEEQAEEETNARDVLQLMKLGEESKTAMYLTDRQMGKRESA